MSLGEVARQHEAEAGSAWFAGNKRLEQTVAQGLVHPWTIIADLDLRPCTGAQEANL